MHFVCLTGVLSGSFIMMYNIVFYYRLLVSLRKKSYAKKTFSRWTYVLCMGLMIFFLIGYLTMGTAMLMKNVHIEGELLISSIFFFGAIFVTVVLNVQSSMNQIVQDKTDEIIKSLVNAMEAKDRYTRGHSVHVANLVDLFYGKLPQSIQRKVQYAQLMDAAILHDIGKIGLPDEVLNKPGSLDENEWAMVRTHPRIGKEILEHTSFSELGDIILMHHERVDQQGYYRTPADQIPIESRIISIADTFSALYTDRVYRPRKSYQQAMDILAEAAGTQLDKQLVDLFLEIPEEEILLCSRSLFALENTESSARYWLKTV